MNNFNIDNIFSTTLRDTGEVALIDGDTKQIINIVKTGYAVHISRVGIRPLPVGDRPRRQDQHDRPVDGEADNVAEIRVGLEARSVDTSVQGLRGQVRDRRLLLAAAVRDHEGRHAEPLKIVGTRGMTVDTQEYHPEPRVAAIVASHEHPSSSSTSRRRQDPAGQLPDIDNPQVTEIGAARFLHDGGWDATHRYFLMAANQSNKVAVVDCQGAQARRARRRRQDPAPGRGANFIDPKFGRWGHQHLGDDRSR